MQPDTDNQQSNRRGGVGVADREQEPGNNNYVSGNQTRPYSAAEEARQLLDELAGLENRHRPARRDTGQKIRSILLAPFTAIIFLTKFITGRANKADFRLMREMLQFLKHPGHFFWFNRVAPQQASQYFGTSSTDVMTNHARRYGAHTAIIFMAVIVVVFGGFGNLVTRVVQEDMHGVSNAGAPTDLKLVGDVREIYASAVAADTTLFPRRIKTEIIKSGDTLRSVAAANNVSLETLLYANAMEDPDTEIKVGNKLVIPPVTGMLHIAQNGDTIGTISDKYGVDPRVIISFPFNQFQNADATTRLKPLQEVMVPGGAKPARDTLYMYTVRSGDTLKTVSAKFGISPDTIVENNDIEDSLKIGQQIRILPVDGVIYNVKAGDTLDGVAQYLSANPQNIINFRSNNVVRGVKLQTGQSLIVPGGVWPPPPPPPPPPPDEPPPPPPAPKPVVNAPANNSATAPKVAPLPNRQTTTGQQPAQQQPKPAAPGQAVKPVQQQPKPAAPAPAPAKTAAPAPAQPRNSAWGQQIPAGAGVATGNMVWPSRGVITTYFGQSIWYGIHAGLDIASGCGTPILAADGGTVVLAAWDGGYGNSVLLDHGNGIRTRYGHFRAPAPVGVGARVTKGQVIGYEGTTGNSTGCHLHFEVIQGGGVRNPLNYLP